MARNLAHTVTQPSPFKTLSAFVPVLLRSFVVRRVCLLRYGMAHGPARFPFSVSGRDVLWERVYDSLPEPLARALLDADLDVLEIGSGTDFQGFPRHFPSSFSQCFSPCLLFFLVPALVFFILLCFPLRYRYAVFTSDSGVLQAALEGIQLDIIEIVVPEFDVWRDLSMFLVMNLLERGYSFIASAEKEIVPDVKEKPCYVCLDFGTEHKSLAQADKENVYVLPEGNIITVATNVSVARNCCSQHSAHGRLDVDFQRLAPRIIF